MIADHPMFLEYDWTSNTYRSHLCGAGTSVAHSFETLAASRHALHLIGLRIGDKTDERTWRIEFMNLSPSALTSPGWEVGPNRPIKRPRSPAKAKGRQRALWRACGRPGPEVVKRPSFCLWRGSAA